MFTWNLTINKQDAAMQINPVTVDEDGNTLELQWSLSRYMIVYFDVPAPFYDTVTFEIIADFSGTFYEESTNTYVPSSGPGWSDWSGQAFPE